MCSLNSICNHGRTAVRRLCPLTCACPLREAHNRQGWAVGSLLSSSHSRVSFAIHVEHCHNNSGSLFVGVCDAVGQVGWGVCLWSGLVESFQCDPSRHVMSAHPRPVGLPHTNYEHGMKDAADQPEGGANGADRGFRRQWHTGFPSQRRAGSICPTRVPAWCCVEAVGLRMARGGQGDIERLA